TPTGRVGRLRGAGGADGGEACDDGNGAAGDGCDAQCQVEPCYQCIGSPSQCAPAILSCGGGAAASHGSTLKLRAGSSSRLPVLRWSTSTPDPVTIDMLGDPRILTSYHLCLFDRSDATPRLLARSSFLFGACWRASKTGFTYRERAGDERRMIQVRVGKVGKASTRLRASFLRALSLPLPVPLTLQLVTTNAGCFDADFSPSGVVQNDVGGFRAVSDP